MLFLQHFNLKSPMQSPMIKMIGILVDKGFAYIGKNGDVFFEIAKFKDYGKIIKKY